jgi:DNA gyrase subunit A
MLLSSRCTFAPARALMTDPTPPPGGRITDLLLEREMRESYLNYSMSVILSRALPDARDGLKPSQRRVLVAMNDLNLGPRSKHRKCAKICGDTSGNYHPHGESVVYPTWSAWRSRSRRATRWSTARATSAPSTAARPRRCATRKRARLCRPMHLLEDLDKETVDEVPNYDGTRMQPVVLPARFPNLICNGSTGIAVGMAASLPPHNLREVAEGAGEAARQPRGHARRAARGRAGARLPDRRHDHGAQRHPQRLRQRPRRCGARQVPRRGEEGRKLIVFTEVPYQVKTTTILERIDHLVKSDQIDSIADANDESTTASACASSSSSRRASRTRSSPSTSCSSCRRCRARSRSSTWRSSTAGRARSASSRCSSATAITAST